MSDEEISGLCEATPKTKSKCYNKAQHYDINHGLRVCGMHRRPRDRGNDVPEPPRQNITGWEWLRFALREVYIQHVKPTIRKILGISKGLNKSKGYTE